MKLKWLKFIMKWLWLSLLTFSCPAPNNIVLTKSAAGIWKWGDIAKNQSDGGKIQFRWFSSTRLLACCFGFYGPQLYCLGSLPSSAPRLALTSNCFQHQKKNTVCYRHSSKWHTDRVSNQLVNIAERLAAKEPNLSLRSLSGLKEEWILNFR